MNLSPDHRIAGVLAPLFAIRTETDLGVGDLEGLRQFVDWAAGVGFQLVQLLPINETGGDNSPYNAISAMAIEPTTLHLAPGSPEDLTAEDFEEVLAQVNVAKMRSGTVKYGRVRQLKTALLEKAFAQFQRRGADEPEALEDFTGFCDSESSWLEEYVLFRALMELNDGREAWDHWPDEHRSPTAAARWLEEQASPTRIAFAERQMFFRYVQWIAFSQWREMKSYAEKRGVALMGDVPFGVSYYSADVFARRDQFALEWSGGAPPEPYFKDDEFTQKWGQNWGFPLYRWDVMRADNFAWWRQRVRGVRRSFHVFRIDHVLGFFRIYAFPWRPQENARFLPLSWGEMLRETGGRFPQFAPRDDETHENADANRREGEEYLRAILDEARETRLVGEDLGTVPNYVRPSLQSLGIAGFKIPHWETHRDGRIISGSEYQRLSVGTYATHDHKPLRAIWEEAFEQKNASSDQAKSDLAKLAQFAGIAAPSREDDFVRNFYEPVTAALLRSQAWMAVVMITDLLGRKERFNVPGTSADSNWSRRMHMTVARLGSSRGVKRRMKLVRKLLESSGRL